MESNLDESEFVGHLPCDQCGSSDGNALYSDGHTYCFVCYNHEPDGEAASGTAVQAPKKTIQEGLLKGSYQSLPSRGLSERDCRKYDYFTSTFKGQPVQVANYRDSTGEVVAQKVRFKDKKFAILGDKSKMGLYGAHMWSSDKILVICEGEIDTISASKVRNHRWATVGIPNGASSAVKAIKANWDYVNRFETVVLCFDQDDAGRKAALAVAETLPVGKAKIATLPHKDVNDCLVAGEGDAVVSALYQAKEWRPDNIVSASDLRTEVTIEDEQSSVTYPYARLNEITKGLRQGELVTITAGTGIGKTTFVREIAYHLHTQGERLGLIMLEESNKRSLLGLIGLHLDKNVTVDRSVATDDEIEEAFDQLFNDERNIYLYDHFGSSDIDIIIQRITYMVKALGVRWVILDHVSILVSGLATNDERKLIDLALTRLRSEVVQELGIGLIIVSHLRRPEGDKGHEDGAKVRLGQLRGSHSIAQLSDMCVALSVDAEDPDSDTRIISVLKNRFTGQTSAFAGTVEYHRDTGRLLEEGERF